MPSLKPGTKLGDLRQALPASRIFITLKKWLNIHVDASSEISLELEPACDRLRRAGNPPGNRPVPPAQTGSGPCPYSRAPVLDSINVTWEEAQGTSAYAVSQYIVKPLDIGRSASKSSEE